MRTVVLAPDLVDRSKIEAVLPEARFVGAAAQLPAAAEGADLVVVDLARAGVLDVLGTVAERAGRVVAFGPHTATEAFAAATAAGAVAMPRSTFFADPASAVGAGPGAET
jgi:hypothetical protein